MVPPGSEYRNTCIHPNNWPSIRVPLETFGVTNLKGVPALLNAICVVRNKYVLNCLSAIAKALNVLVVYSALSLVIGENFVSAATEPPNVLFIAIDDMNDWLGCLEGHPNAKTPHIDSLAERGVLFTNAHCQAPICAPSRASVFSGLLPTTSGIYLQINDRHLRSSNPATKNCTYLPDFFEKHGYRTYGVGKLFHKGDRAKVFDEYGGWNSGYGPSPKKRINYSPKMFGKPGKTQTDWGAFPDADEKMPDYEFAQWAIKKINQEHEQPFFLAVGFVRPHVPWYLPPVWFEEHELSDVQTPPYLDTDLNDVPELAKQIASVPMMPTTEGLKNRKQWKEIVHAYLACCTWTDHWVGEVLRALDQSPYADNTVIVLWSDHGYHLGEKNRFAKQALWERSTRVPLIFVAPRIKGGTMSSRPVGLIDIYPTLTELCGLPENPENEGRSLVPLLKDVTGEWKSPAITSYGPVNFAVRGDKFRYIVYEGGVEELYDMQTDPYEWKNLAQDEAFDGVISEMRRHIPAVTAPLAKGSSYDINGYFRDRLEKWDRADK